ncbi:hypothetical protein COT95_02350 [Candidatus Falkowbacteria bacterium CG10_big_fil_rev_8_21_14_0_10_37_6]|uniref:Blue (type 1) copper domain-containing protein n=1 Tax=Candidatus Falkowbacteria bacterium CG10_big_fil_rev_8_21_14_0_10_37_6 TaxID=1974563 RepID=A0A2H0V8W8_9BACT|nr:MAG: hypothetical protein COT95_02350 [Candidatus Falkowbacteria bacterium CG10_big_fil_rev_8_21_14_0_10_37_6]
MNKKLFYTSALLSVAVLLGAAGCQKQNVDNLSGNINEDSGIVMDGEKTEEVMMDEDEGGETANKNDDVMMDDSAAKNMMNEDGIKTFIVEGGMFYFSPKEISVNKGDKVKIVFKNVEGVHDWVVDEFNARTKIIKTGETDEVEFIADKTGSFEYYCSVGTHRQQGMVGVLKVN